MITTPGLDFRVDLGSVADDQHVATRDFTLEATVDPDAALEVQLPLGMGAPAEEGGDPRWRAGVVGMGGALTPGERPVTPEL